MKRIGLLITLIILIAIVFLAACSSPQQEPQNVSQPTAQSQSSSSSSASLDGKALVEERCTKCHSLRPITSGKRSANEWQGIVQNMISRGAQLNSDEQAAVVKYLSENYGN